MSCTNPGATHHGGCECWEARVREEARADAAKRLQLAEERRAALFVKAHLDRRAAAGELKKLRARIAELEAKGTP